MVPLEYRVGVALEADDVEKRRRWGRRRRNIAGGGGGAFVGPAWDEADRGHETSTKSGKQVETR